MSTNDKPPTLGGTPTSPSRPAVGTWGRAVAVVLLMLAGVGCGSQPLVVGPKVQTVHELMVKLKKGFDESALDTPEFYARELGYALERPETFKTLSPPYAPSRQIKFDSGELAGAVAEVGPLVASDGRRFVSFRGANIVRRLPGRPCVQLAEIQGIWGVIPPEPEAWGAHGPLPVLHYLYRSGTDGMERSARFSVDKQSGCVQSGPAVSQYLE